MRVRYSFSSRRTGHIDNMLKQRQKVPDIIKNLIRISDIVLEILDARFIEETRNLELEKEIKDSGKNIVYVLNKADLADIKQAKEKLEILKLNPYIFISCTKRKGKSDLIRMIKMEAKKSNYPRAHIGIIGYPNTGKSSLINYLTGRGSAGTAREAGFTKGIQKIKLAEGILLLDSPGVIPENENSAVISKDLVKHAKINVRTFDKVKNPEFVVSELMKEYPGVFEKYYEIDAKGDSEILIEQLGKKKGLIIKGGEVDCDRVSRVILKDWQAGKIRV